MARAIETVHAAVGDLQVTVVAGVEYPDTDPVVVAHPEWFEDVRPAAKKAAAKSKGV